MIIGVSRNSVVIGLINYSLKIINCGQLLSMIVKKLRFTVAKGTPNVMAITTLFFNGRNSRFYRNQNLEDVSKM